MNADLALQQALIARLALTPAVTALVPVAAILDRNARPAPSPSIVIGESQAIEGDDYDRMQLRVVATLHIWKREPSLEGVKFIAGSVRAAVHAGRLQLPGGFHCGDCRVSSMRFLRDDDGETSHGVVTVEALVEGP